MVSQIFDPKVYRERGIVGDKGDSGTLMDLEIGNRNLVGIDQINIILGKNGAGKSSLLRQIDTDWRGRGFVTYITPERGGELSVQGGIETNRANPDWLPGSRRRNRDEQFRHASVSQYQRLEAATLRRIESDQRVRQSEFTFESVITEINGLLDNVRIVRDVESNSFKVQQRVDNANSNVGDLSSGETELISLAIEILTIYRTNRSLQRNREPTAA
jgi:ATPase subunit of ABC transporter with duplicated ATPase domains